MTKAGWLRCAMLASTALLSTNANAQEAQADDSAATSDGEIIVTAQRRSENIQKVPIAVTAISEERAQALNLKDVGTLQLVTPGMIFSNGINYASTYIRGTGAQLPNPGVESSVATYIDGAYIEHAFGSVFDVLDTQSMQVLKGPQGSLWGRNASGGVILINTADPEFRNGGRVLVEAGNLDHQLAEGVVNLAASDTVAFRFAARYRNDGGYIRNLVDGFKFGGRESWTVRGKVKIQPSDAFSAVLSVQYDHQKRSPQAYTAYLPAQYCLICGSSAYTYPRTDRYTTVANTLNNGLGGRDSNVAVNLKMDYDLSDELTLSSVTSYRHLNAFETGDFDLTEIDVLNIANSTIAKTWTQDVTLSSDFKGIFNFTAGLNYLHDDSKFALGFPPASSYPNWPHAFDNVIGTESISGFFDGTVEPTPGLKLTAGGRYTSDSRSMFSDRPKFNRFTKRFVIAYDAGQFNLWASYNDGFKSGGVVADKSAPPAAIFRPERASSYEAGVKFTSIDGRIRANISAFTYKNRDLQVLAVDQSDPTNLGKTFNADAKGSGVEFEGNFDASDNFQMFGGFAYLDATYTKFLYNQALSPVLAPDGTPQTFTEDLAGFRVPRAPKWTWFVGATVKGNVSSDWKAELTGFVRHSSSYDFQPGAGGPMRRDQQVAFTTARASLNIMPQDERYTIGFFVDNLTNETYSDFRFATPPFGSSEVVARPRTYGVRLSAKFD